MLPSQKIELAIYKRINALGPGQVTTSLGILSGATGQDHAAIAERLRGLASEHRINLFKDQGYGPLTAELLDVPGFVTDFLYAGSFLVEILPQARKYFERLEQEAEQEAEISSQSSSTAQKQLIFISCGQSTPAERQLGNAVAKLVEQETGCSAYFAQNQTGFEGVTENILRALHRAVAFIAIMHPRGDVSNPHGSTDSFWVRGSVWVEQEIAIAAFISQALQRPIRERVYVHESIQREGLRDKLHLNPKSFRGDAEILTDLATLLPSWRDLAQQRPKEPLSLKANIRRQRLPIPGGDGGRGDELYSLMVSIENDGEQDVTDFMLDVEFPGNFLDGGGHIARKGVAKPGFATFLVSNKDVHPPIEHLYPSTSTPNILTFNYAILGNVKRERPELLQQMVTATVYSGNMKPKVTSKTISELMD
jgi:hypothetical protein